MEGKKMSNLDYEINKELGECYLFMGELDKAEEYYKKAASSNGVHPDPYLGLATIAVQKGEIDTALTLYRKAESIEANDKSLGGIGLVLMEQGEHEQALEAFIKALEYNPKNMLLINTAIQEAHYLNRLGDIVPSLEATLDLNPEMHAVRFALTGCLVHLGCEAEALLNLETILSFEPEHAEAKELYDALKNN